MQKNKNLDLILSISDSHVPGHDRKLFKAIFKWCKQYKPTHVMLNGDIGDFEAVSGHGGNATPPKLQYEVDCVAAFLDEVRAANPQAKIAYLEGNHEDRLTRWIAKNAANLEGALDLPSMLELKKRKISWHKYGEVVHVGKIGYVHGFYCNKHFAASHMDGFGESLVIGHTHKFQSYTKGIDGSLARGVFGMGCTCMTKNVPYIKGRPSGWQQGFGATYVDKRTGEFWVNSVIANNGRFVWNGEIYA